MTSLLEQGVERKEAERMKIQKCIIAFVGPPLMGKSTLGKELAQQTNATLLDMDEIRWEIFPRTERLSPTQEMFSIQTTYQRMHEKTRDLLLKNQPVILVAAYSRSLYHQMLKELVQRANAPLIVLNPQAPLAEIVRRSREREKKGNASTTTTIDEFLEAQHRFTLIPDVTIHTIDTTLPLEENINTIMEALQSLRAK